MAISRKAAQAFKTALSAVAGETANTTSGSRRRSVAERLTMSSATRHAMDAKDAERSKAWIVGKMVCKTGGRWNMVKHLLEKVWKDGRKMVGKD